jgi:hypothetical protein
MPSSRNITIARPMRALSMLRRCERALDFVGSCGSTLISRQACVRPHHEDITVPVSDGRG